ncbi:NmrA/HSCARG family protein [Dyadobacter sandarakinus]|uniref:NmrA/HSCARG family protein n=1 Tax=Dyadobacter sandarakinus TaxID=2747268 RepID=A0ABX7I3D5_9BACT|nr:NmrA/HSCARG family protein [Dyadobacter sandarakinus]QRR00310.1 NmrA/HSCARG family protein [Dyadobacter sandarakinus]
MNSKKTIAVFGATGGQGGGLAHAILDDPERTFSVRAVTRHPDSEAARVLAMKGAEVVFGDLNEPESVRQVLRGAYAAYFVTFFWEHFSPEKELMQAKTMAQEAAAAGLEHAIWSTLEDTRALIRPQDPNFPTLMGRYKVPHFDAKGEANRFFTEAGVPVTFLLTSFYWDNFVNLGMGPKRDAAGKWALTLPLGNRRLAGIAAEDIGRCAYGVFKAGQAMIGQTVGIAGEHLTGAEMAQMYSDVIGEDVTYNDIPCDVYRSLGFPGSDDLANMFRFYQDYEVPFCAARNVDRTRMLNPALRSFAAWLAENAAVLR